MRNEQRLPIEMMKRRSRRRGVRPPILTWGLLLAFGVLIAGAGTGLAAVVPDAVSPGDGAEDGAVRVKNLAAISGMRGNQLTGLGLVVGLSGTGDSPLSTANVQMVTNLLENFGVGVDAQQVRTRNVAAVMVTAELPAFARPGQQIDVAVGSIGDARSLEGGMLLQTPLTGADGNVYAVAQGALSIGTTGDDERYSVRTDETATARIPSGAFVEAAVPGTELGLTGGRAPIEEESLTLLLHRADFTTASRIAEVVNRTFTATTAEPIDAGAVRIRIPPAYTGRPVAFAAAVENLPVTPDAVPRVVINERTGTLVGGTQVRVAGTSVTHGDIHVAAGGGTVDDLVQGLLAVGAGPKDVISILQALKDAGALYGELTVL